MAILPRCYTSGFSTTSAQYNLPLTGWTNAGAGVSGTAPAAGDTVIVTLINNTAAVGPPSQIAGSPFTFLVGPTAQSAGGSFFTVYAIRQWTGGETTPSWLFQSGSRIVWVAVAITPDSGMQLIVDAQATEKIDTAATSHTGPAVSSPGGSSDFALLSDMVSASAAGNTAITFTTPASWTLVSSANNIGTAGQFVDAVGVWYRTGVTSAAPGAQTIQGGAGATSPTEAVMDVVLLREVPVVALPDVSGATESLLSGQPTYPAEFGGGVDAFAGAATPPYADFGAAGDETLSVAVAEVLPVTERGGAADGFTVTKLPVPGPVPGLVARIASPAFILSRMPRMHVQNLITGQWLHRDVQGIASPSITWQLNTPDSFTCTLAPPRPDLMTAAGEPLLSEWRDACYLEENDEIKFGGILTSSSFAGPQWGLTFTGFMGYPAGMPYEGADYVKTRIDALDVVRDLWSWLQAQPNANIHLDLDSTDSGVLLGANVPSGASSTLLGNSRAGSTVIKVHDAGPFNPKMKVSIAGGAAHIVKSTSPTNKTITLTTPTANAHSDGDPIAQVMSPTPIAIYWYNSTDIGQEIGNIQTEAVFDMWETHNWTNAAKAGVAHRLHFGVPRAGRRQSTLRFAEGENVVEAVQGTRDGASYANEVVGLGSGQGKAQIRAQVGQLDGHLRRVLVYSDGTVTTKARMQSKAQRILASRMAIDTPTTVVVKNHPNAPFGSFVPGDDIYVIWATGWRNTGIWGRITSMTQDPTTDLMTLTLARSDSFTYLAQSGQAGTV